MIKCNCEEKNFIKVLAVKVHQKMNVGNETQLPMMCTYQSIKMDVYTDTYRRTKYIYLIILEDIFRKIIFMLVFLLLLPNDTSHLELLDLKYKLSSTVFLHQCFHLFTF